MNNRPANEMSRRTLLQAAGAALGGSMAMQVSGSVIQSNQESDIALTIPAWYYQHHDADYSLPVPEHGFGGWMKENLEFSRAHTAVVVMHAWETGTREEFPGWWRVVPYIPRANRILREVFPPILEAVRASDMPLFHVVGGGDYYRDLPGCKRAVKLAGPPPVPSGAVQSDPLRDKLNEFRRNRVHPGSHNAKDVQRGFARLDFPKEARPEGEEGVAENGHQLFALCRERGINHLVYCGFAINWCLLLSPGGMAEMQKYGLMCSAIRQATCAVENKETAAKELCKEIALWRVALAFGFVFDAEDFVGAIKGLRIPGN